MLFRLRGDRRGVTFVELLVVMVVLSILASVAMPTLRLGVKRAKEMELRRDLREMRDAIDDYKQLYDEARIPREAGGTGYPKSLEDLVAGVEITNTAPIRPGETQLPKHIRFLRKIPVDPMTGTTDWGLRSMEDDPDSSVWGGEDVFDVYTQSDAMALDGTYYRDW